MLAESLRIFIIKAIRFPFKEIRRLLKMVRPDIWVLKGNELANHYSFSIAYIGTDKKYRNYIGNLAFGDSVKKRKIATDWIWNIPESIRKNAPETSLAMIEMSSFLKSYCRIQNSLIMPKWVELNLDIAKPVEQIFPRKAGYNMRRRIIKNNYTYDVTHEQYLFDEFYYDMYLPSVRNTFDSTAYLSDYLWYIKKKQHSDLLLVKKEGIVIAGIIIENLREKALINYVGYKDGDYTYVKQGAWDALLYFTVEWLKKKNNKILNMGLSMPFLNDGGLKYKILKGAYMVDTCLSLTPETSMAFAFFKNTPGLRNFLVNNPFIFYNQENKRYGAAFIEATGVLSYACEKEFSHSGKRKRIFALRKEIQNRLTHFRHYQGIEKWRIYVFGDKSNYQTLLREFGDTEGIEIFPVENLFSGFTIRRMLKFQ